MGIFRRDIFRSDAAPLQRAEDKKKEVTKKTKRKKKKSALPLNPTERAKLARTEHLRKTYGRTKTLNLALQGGGTHGAFTWGVLDRLLQEPRLKFDGISGTSAGALNAVALAQGLMDGGNDKAREKLKDVWEAISKAAFPASHGMFPLLFPGTGGLSQAAHEALDIVSRVMSPYEFNPLDINPLRDVLNEKIDFDKLRKESPVKLFIAATDVASGHARIFRTHEISAESILASACLPTLFKAIEIDGSHYWDGGFSANPDLTTLISQTRSYDTLLVQLTPHHDPELPTRTQSITGGINRITFNQPIRREIELIERSRNLGRYSPFSDNWIKRIHRMRFHLISAENHTSKLDYPVKMMPKWDLLESLYDAGIEEANEWISTNWTNIGKISTIDLYKEFFQNKHETLWQHA